MDMSNGPLKTTLEALFKGFLVCTSSRQTLNVQQQD